MNNMYAFFIQDMLLIAIKVKNKLVLVDSIKNDKYLISSLKNYLVTLHIDSINLMLDAYYTSEYSKDSAYSVRKLNVSGEEYYGVLDKFSIDSFVTLFQEINLKQYRIIDRMGYYTKFKGQPILLYDACSYGYCIIALLDNIKAIVYATADTLQSDIDALASKYNINLFKNVAATEVTPNKYNASLVDSYIEYMDSPISNSFTLHHSNFSAINKSTMVEDVTSVSQEVSNMHEEPHDAQDSNVASESDDVIEEKSIQNEDKTMQAVQQPKLQKVRKHPKENNFRADSEYSLNKAPKKGDFITKVFFVITALLLALNISANILNKKINSDISAMHANRASIELQIENSNEIFKFYNTYLKNYDRDFYSNNITQILNLKTTAKLAKINSYYDYTEIDYYLRSKKELAQVKNKLKSTYQILSCEKIEDTTINNKHYSKYRFIVNR